MSAPAPAFLSIHPARLVSRTRARHCHRAIRAKDERLLKGDPRPKMTGRIAFRTSGAERRGARTRAQIEKGTGNPGMDHGNHAGNGRTMEEERLAMIVSLAMISCFWRTACVASKHLIPKSDLCPRCPALPALSFPLLSLVPLHGFPSSNTDLHHVINLLSLSLIFIIPALLSAAFARLRAPSLVCHLMRSLQHRPRIPATECSLSAYSTGQSSNLPPRRALSPSSSDCLRSRVSTTCSAHERQFMSPSQVRRRRQRTRKRRGRER